MLRKTEKERRVSLSYTEMTLGTQVSAMLRAISRDQLSNSKQLCQPVSMSKSLMLALKRWQLTKVDSNSAPPKTSRETTRVPHRTISWGKPPNAPLLSTTAPSVIKGKHWRKTILRHLLAQPRSIEKAKDGPTMISNQDWEVKYNKAWSAIKSRSYH